MSERRTRRDALTTLLGAPLAAVACRRDPVLSFDGTIVGQDVSHAHALRGPRVSDAEWQRAPVERARVVVVGGGPAGLSCAWTLANTLRGDRDVTVLELEPDPGGTSRWGRSSVSEFPWGAHYVPTPGAHNAEFVSLLRAMDILEPEASDGRVRAKEQHLVRDLDERLWFEGQWREGLYPTEGASAEDLRQWRAFQAEIDRWVRWRDPDGRRAFVLPSTLASDHPEALALDRTSMGRWLRERGFTSARLRWMVDYACRDDYGLRAEHTSAWAGLFYFASRVRAPGEPAEELIAFPEGNGRFVRWFSDRLGPRIKPRVLVREVALLEGGEVEVRASRTDTGALVRHRAARVVLAVPRFVAKRLLPEALSPEEPVGALSYSPWLVANLHLRERPMLDRGGLEMAWDNVLYDSPSLGYVSATHQSMRDHGPAVLTWYLPLCGEDPDAERRKLFAMDWRHCADAAVSDVVRAHPDLARVLTRVDVMRWGHAMARPIPGFLSRRASLDPRGRDPRVLFAHTDRSGLGLFEEAFDRGVRAGKAALEDLARVASGGTLTTS